MILDLFAGPGGWSEGLRLIGLTDIGIELDLDACATRRAAGHATIGADVADLDPIDLIDLYATPPTTATVDGLIASPPCQLYSAAGSGHGRQAIPLLIAAMEATIAGNEVRADTFTHVADIIEAAIAHDYPADGWLPLDGVLTPARAAAETMTANALLVLEPARYIAELRPRWIALEQVPAVLPLWETLADGLLHIGYSAVADIVNAADFGVPQKRRRAILIARRDGTIARIPHPTHAEDGANGLAPWVTMAEALGWAADHPDAVLDRRADYVDGQPTIRPIPLNEAAPTITGELGAKATAVWRFTHTLDEPAPTIAFGNNASEWAWERPATTVAGDSRIWPPGHKINAGDIERLGADEAAARYGDRAGSQAIRISVADALALQTFPPDYPVAGGLSSQFEQIGNAVPPLLAAAIINELNP